MKASSTTFLRVSWPKQCLVNTLFERLWNLGITPISSLIALTVHNFTNFLWFISTLLKNPPYLVIIQIKKLTSYPKLQCSALPTMFQRILLAYKSHIVTVWWMMGNKFSTRIIYGKLINLQKKWKRYGAKLSISSNFFMFINKQFLTYNFWCFRAHRKLL